MVSKLTDQTESDLPGLTFMYGNVNGDTVDPVTSTALGTAYALYAFNSGYALMAISAR